MRGQSHAVPRSSHPARPRNWADARQQELGTVQKHDRCSLSEKRRDTSVADVTIIGNPDDGEPADESEHFEVCPICGQAFDVRVLEMVIYHAQPMHEAMKREG